MATAATKSDWPSHRFQRPSDQRQDEWVQRRSGISRNSDRKDGEFFLTGATVELIDWDVRASEIIAGSSLPASCHGLTPSGHDQRLTVSRSVGGKGLRP